jgi:hypothetical protein
MTKQEQDLIPLSKAAAETGVGESTLRRAAKVKKLKAKRYGRDWLTTLTWVKEWIRNPDNHKHDPRRDDREWHAELSVSA